MIILGRSTTHKRDIVLDKNILRTILERNKMSFLDLYNECVKRYGLDIRYKGFMNLLDNRSSWKLLYAYAVTDVLDVALNDIFIIIDTDNGSISLNDKL